MHLLGIRPLDDEPRKSARIHQLLERFPILAARYQADLSDTILDEGNHGRHWPIAPLVVNVGIVDDDLVDLFLGMRQHPALD